MSAIRTLVRDNRRHEISRFVREDGRWYYVDGDVGGEWALKEKSAVAVRHIHSGRAEPPQPAP